MVTRGRSRCVADRSAAALECERSRSFQGKRITKQELGNERSYAQARRAANAYACRWLIEEYHKALKTGTHIEDSQLASAPRIEALLAIHAVIAAELLKLKLLAEALPAQPAGPQTIAPERLAVLEALHGRPPEGWTHAALTNAIARMGGYLARKNDGPPGWLSLWRGWLKLTIMTEGYLLATQQKTCG